MNFLKTKEEGIVYNKFEGGFMTLSEERAENIKEEKYAYTNITDEDF